MDQLGEAGHTLKRPATPHELIVSVIGCDAIKCYQHESSTPHDKVTRIQTFVSGKPAYWIIWAVGLTLTSFVVTNSVLLFCLSGVQGVMKSGWRQGCQGRIVQILVKHGAQVRIIG